MKREIYGHFKFLFLGEMCLSSKFRNNFAAVILAACMTKVILSYFCSVVVAAIDYQ